MNDNDNAILIRKGPDRDEEAMRWHLHLHSGEADETDQQAYARWRRDASNASAYDEIDSIWSSFGSVLPGGTIVVPFRKRRYLPFRLDRQFAAVAASVLAITAGSYQYLHVWQHDYVTQGSARTSAVLPDGSRVALNTGAAIDVAYADGVRRVRLVRGEAYFDVRHDPAHPFVVNAGSGQVGVLGTAFSVTRDGAHGNVIVQRGRVRVRSGAGFVDVAPNRSVSFDASGNGAVRSVDANAVLGWSAGRLYLRDMKLSDVIAALDRYHPGIVMLRDKAAAQRRVSAVVQLDNIQGWLDGMARTQRLTVQRYPGVTIIG